MFDNETGWGVMKNSYITAGNPYLPLWEHLPDGEPRVFEDPDNPGKLRLYIIGSHDLRVSSYCGADIRAWSAPVDDLTHWRDEGSIFTYEADGEWDVMFAPDLVEVMRKNGEKEYYLYPHSRGPGREAMVAKGSSPVGPFTPVNATSDGRETVPGSVMGFDPAVYIEYITDPADPDFDIGFRAYGYWGFQKSYAAELDQNTMYSIRPGTKIIEHFIPSSFEYGAIRDPEGTAYPNVYPDEDLKAFNFYEAASIRKVGNKYIWVYSGFSGPDYGLSSTNSALRYAYGDTPLGPWKSGGVLVDSRAPVQSCDGDALQVSYAGHNTHGSIEQINGQWYAFYHRAPRSFGNARQAMVAPVIITWDEKPVAEGGMVSIRAWEPYAPRNTWTAKASEDEYTGAEVTSEGFHIYGLDPYKYYSAGIACYLSSFDLQTDAWDIWDNHAPLSGVSDGDIIGYKYFGFGGLLKDINGLRAFEGSCPGKNTRLDLFLETKTDSGFKISIRLDKPWSNAVCGGMKIGEISIPANASRQGVVRHSADVSGYVDNLDGKHALFLVAEGGEGALFDLHGLGFSSAGHEIARPYVPAIGIKVNGVSIDLPRTPVRSTDANGITGYDIYEIPAALPCDKGAMPDITASADTPDVGISVCAPDASTGMAVVKFEYKGLVKTYRLLS